MDLTPLPVAVPLLVAAVLVGAAPLLSRRVLDTIACLTAAGNLGVCLLLVRQSSDAPLVTWFGGWRPIGHFPIGIAFVVDPLGAGLAALVSVLMLTSLVVSWAYFESIKSLYHAIMLVFLAAMCGLCLTGDLFNLFVWFELMTAAGVTLCGYKVEEVGALQGGLNFAVMNMLGAYLSLSGVALVYARTGALNFAAAAEALAAASPHDAFVPIAFLFVISGFLVKAASFPFHFWLADAHAAAPTPVCVLFSGVMVELGVYAVARLYWVVFAVPLSRLEVPTSELFLAIGTLTALVGAVACFAQRHLKRLLAFSTISHVGLMIIGFSLLSPGGLAGSALYLVGHGLVKASLFICAGMLLNRFESVDEFELQGAGRKVPLVGLLMACGALGLAGLPPCANFFGECLIDESARQLGRGWISLVFVIAGVLTSGAVLRATGRIFLGWGPAHEATSRGARDVPMDREMHAPPSKLPLMMWLPALLLVVGATVIAPAADLGRRVLSQAHAFQDGPGYAALVLEGQRPAAPAPGGSVSATARDFGRQAGVALGALAAALLALFPHALGERISRVSGMLLVGILKPIRLMHSGKIGDYVAWFVLGVGVYGLILVWA
ncbi:MAG TPA: proton-conducting transporter membrane subunit [Pirellulales bacterium]